MQTIPKNLIKKASKGDMKAFEEIYNITSSYVYTVAYRVTGNQEDAEEVAQDVFIRVYKNLSKFEFKSSFKTWIYRITVNLSINLIKKRNKKRDKTVCYDDAILSESYDETIKKREDKEENEHKVKRMLSCLSPEHRICIVLKEIQGLKYEEIAQSLKIKIGTVKSRLKRAREILISLYRKGGGKNEV